MDRSNIKNNSNSNSASRHIAHPTSVNGNSSSAQDTTGNVSSEFVDNASVGSVLAFSSDHSLQRVPK